MVTISEHLEAFGVLQDLGGISALAEMARNTPSASNVYRLRRDRRCRTNWPGAAGLVGDDAWTEASFI